MKRRARLLFFCSLALLAGLSAGATARAEGHDKEPAHGGEHAGGEHAGGEHHGVSPMNWADFSDKKTPPYVAIVVNFAVLLFAYYSLGKKPIAAALKQRKHDIGQEIEDAQKLLDDAKARAAQHKKSLKNVGEEGEAAKSALREAGEGERDRIVKDAEEKAARIARDAAFLVEQESKQLRLELTRETVEEAVAQAHVLLRAAVTQADHERMAEEFLADLGGKHSGALASGPASAPGGST